MSWYIISSSVYKYVQYVYVLAASYLLFVLVYRVVKERCKWSGVLCNNTDIVSDTEIKGNLSDESFRRRACSRSLRSKRHSVSAQTASKAMAVLSILANLFVLVHTVLDVFIFSTQYRASLKMICIRQSITGILYLLFSMCVYLFLWVRQRVFYNHPILRHLSGPTIIRFSWSVLITIVVSILTFIVISVIQNLSFDWKNIGSNLYYLPKNFEGTSEKNTTTIVPTTATPNVFYDELATTVCTFRRKRLFRILHLLLTVLFLYFQISLQILFAYPVLKNKSFSKKKVGNQMNKERLQSKHVNMELNNKKTKVNNGFQNETYETTLLDKSMMIKDKVEWANNLSSASEKDSFKSLHQHRERKTSHNGSCQNSSLKKAKSDAVSLHSVALYKNKKINVRSRLRCYVWRCFAMSLVCCVSDALAFGFSIFTQKSSHPFLLSDFYASNSTAFLEAKINARLEHETMYFEEKVTSFLLSGLAYNASMIINVLCLIICYDNWYSILLPCTTRC